MTLDARSSSVQLLVAAVAAVAIFVYALGQGGYDVVDRQRAALIIWWGVGLAALVVSPAPRSPSRSGIAVTACATGIALWIALTIGDSVSQERSAIELARAVAHLGPLVLVGWALPPRLWKALLAGIAAGAVGVCVASLGDRLSPGFLGQTTAVVFANTTSRLSAPLGYWNAVGSWATLTVLVLVGWSAHLQRPWARALVLAWAPLAVTVAYLTYSRSTVGAAAVGLIVLVALSEHRWTSALHVTGIVGASAAVLTVVRSNAEIANATGTAGGGTVLTAVVVAGLASGAIAAVTALVGADRWRLPQRTGRIVAVSTALAALAVVLVIGVSRGSDLWERFSTAETQTATNSSTADPNARFGMINNGTRVNQWRVAWEDFEDHPWSGTGAGTFELTYNERAIDTQFVRDAHNAFLETLSEQGVIGGLLLAGLIASAAALAVRTRLRAATALDRGLIATAAAGFAAFAFGTAFDWFWEVSALAMVAMTLVGVLMAAGKGVDAPTDAQTHGRGTALRAGLVVVAVVGVLVQLPGLIGTSTVRRSEQSAARGELVLARSQADEAIDLMPWASSPFLQRALVDERAGEYTAARRSITLAIARDPRDWRLPLVLARIEARAGNAEAAVEAYRDAKRLRPRGRFFG